MPTTLLASTPESMDRRLFAHFVPSRLQAWPAEAVGLLLQPLAAYLR